MGDDFFTFSESIKKDNAQLTPSMEDYVEMIYRLSLVTGFTRIHDLSHALHVQPPSVTKMMQKLAELGFVNYEKYGVVRLTPMGEKKGNMLLSRHHIIQTFLKTLGVTESLLEETEKIEHTVSKETLVCIADFLNFLNAYPEVLKNFEAYRKSKIYL